MSASARKLTGATLRGTLRQMIDPSTWSLMGVLKGGLSIIFGGVLLYILGIWLDANVRNFIEERHWDKLLTRVWAKMPIPDLRPYRSFWFAFGLVAGGATIAWLLPEIGPTATTKVPPQAATPPKPINPLHDEATKWRVASNLRFLPEGIRGCEVVIVRYQLPYAEHYAEDIKEIFKTAGWNFREKFAMGTLPRGLSLRAPHSDPQHGCAVNFKGRLEYDVRPAPTVSLDWIESSAPSPYLAECTDTCFEIDIGNDPAQ